MSLPRSIKQAIDYNPAFSIYDESNPLSLINKVPDKMRPLMRLIREKIPSVHMMTEASLREAAHADDQDDRVRIAFWDEYDRACTNNTKMLLSRFLQGTIPLETWLAVYERNPYKFLFVITPIKSYAQAMRALLNRGLDRLNDILALPIVRSDGKPDTAVISQVMKAIQMIDLRVKGSIIQKVQIQQQSLQVNANVSQKALSELTIEELEAMSKKLDKMSSQEFPADVKEQLEEDSRREEALTLDMPAVGAIHEN